MPARTEWTAWRVWWLVTRYRIACALTARYPYCLHHWWEHPRWHCTLPKREQATR